MKRKIEIGEVTAQVRQGGIAAYDFAALNPWRFSSEYADDASATVYYNYRHYEPTMGRWMSRDTIEEKGGVCLYIFLDNQVSENSDFVGLIFDQCEIGERRVKEIRTKILPQTWDVNNDVENKISIVSTVATGLTLVSSFGSGHIQGGVWCGVGSAFGDGGKSFIEGNIVDLYVESIKKSSGRFSGWKIWTKAIWEKCECSSFMFIPRREFVEKEGKWEQCEYGGFRFGDSYIIQNPTSSRVEKCVTLRLKNELKKRE